MNVANAIQTRYTIYTDWYGGSNSGVLIQLNGDPIYYTAIMNSVYHTLDERLFISTKLSLEDFDSLVTGLSIDKVRGVFSNCFASTFSPPVASKIMATYKPTTLLRARCLEQEFQILTLPDTLKAAIEKLSWKAFDHDFSVDDMLSW